MSITQSKPKTKEKKASTEKVSKKRVSTPKKDGAKNVSTQNKFDKDLKQVQDQYLDYPYPLRDPENDKTKIMRMQGDFLAEINHSLYKGKKDFSGFRALVAGGGTGDSTVWLAKQLMEYPDTEVVYLDFSKASMAIAEQRAKNHGINNITWIEDSILNIPDLDLGKFDFINCTGVLHHLQDPNIGLKNLADSLKDDGGMSIMVYAKYGRTGVYHIQEIMNMVNKDITNRAEEVKSGWDVINSLPATNWFKKAEELIGDHKMFGDIGLYDLFLHKQDRCYSIPELYEFVENAGMNITSLVEPYNRALLNVDSYFPESSTKERIKTMDIKTQQAICEVMCGNIIKHSIHISKNKDTIADYTDLDNVPFILYNADQMCQYIINFIDTNAHEVMNKIMKYTITDSYKRSMDINILVLPSTKYLFKYLEKGEMSLKEIFAAIRAETGSNSSDKQLLNESLSNIQSLNTVGSLLMRHKSVKPFNIFPELG